MSNLIGRTVVHYAVPPSDRPVGAVTDLMSTYHEMIVRGLSSAGRVRPARFWRLNTLGDTEVFTGAQAPIKRVQASVALLWDFSSSQGSFKSALVHSIQVVGSSLQRAGINVWAGAYTTESQGVGIFEVNGWREKWDHRRTLSLYDVNMGDTPTGAAMRFVRRFVLPRSPTNRRMLIVCTDGGPGDGGVADYEVLACRGFGPVIGLYVGSNSRHRGLATLAPWTGARYSFDAPTREAIPEVFTQILARLRG